MEMRACDHKAVQDLAVTVFVPPAEQKQSFNIPPYYWFENCSDAGPTYVIPKAKVLPKADPKLCK